MNYFILRLSRRLLELLESITSLFFTSTIKHELIFYQSGFFRVPDNVDIIYVTAIAGGGSGCTFIMSGYHGGGGGGGSGAYCVNYPLKVIPGSEISIIVGAGGTAPGSTGGSNGGNTQCAGLILLGGQGGQLSTNPEGGNGGSVWDFPGASGGNSGKDGVNGGFLFNKTYTDSHYYSLYHLKEFEDLNFFTYSFPGAGGGGGWPGPGGSSGSGGKCGDPSSYDLPSTPTFGDYSGGIGGSGGYSGGGGASSPWGQGGKGGVNYNEPGGYPPENGSGYGSGGGGAGVDNWGTTGGNGTSGFVYIKYYQPN